MAEPIVRWFYSFDDPYCYIAWPVAERIAEEYAVTVESIPVWPLEALEDEDPQWEQRVAYRLRDAKRMADFYEMKFAATAPMSLDAARRLACVAEGARELRKDEMMITAGLSAVWGAGENFDHVEAVRAVCDEADIPWETAAAWIEDADIQQRLENNRALLTKLGHYDTAMFEFNSTWYWGVDRLEFLIDDLEAKGLKKE